MYLKKDGFPSKISTKLKETQSSYNVFQAQHHRKPHAHCLVLVSSHSVKAVVSTGQFGDRSVVHGSLFCNSNLFSGNISLHSLKLVLLVLSSRGWAGAWGLFLARYGAAGARSRSLLHAGTTVHLLFLQLLLKSHQVCRNLLFVALAGCTQVFKPQHCIHPAAGLKLV